MSIPRRGGNASIFEAHLAPALQSLDAHVEFTELKMKYEQSFEAFFRKFILLAAQSGKDVNDGT